MKSTCTEWVWASSPGWKRNHAVPKYSANQRGYSACGVAPNDGWEPPLGSLRNCKTCEAELKEGQSIPTPESVQVFARVMTSACEHFGSSVKDTVGKTRSVQASLARHATIAVMSGLGYTSAHIAGLMDRTSGGISASLRKSRDLMETEKGFQEFVNQLVVTELQRNKERK